MLHRPANSPPIEIASPRRLSMGRSGAQLFRNPFTRLRIDLDPVVPHRRPHLVVGGLGNDHVGRLHRHMAVDTVLRNPVPQRLRNPTTLPLMARQALRRIARRRPLLRMNIMARRTAHRRRRKIAPASLQQSHLVPMHIGMLRRRPRQRLEVVAQRPPRHVRKRRSDRLSLSPVMTQRAKVHLPIARKLRWIQNRLPGRLSRARLLPRDMRRARPMASLARNPTHKTILLISICRRIHRQRPNRSRMALQAPRVDRPRKIRRPIRIPRTIDPPMSLRPVAHRQFIQAISLPIEIRRPAHARARHDIHPLASALLLFPPPGHSRLIKPAIPGFHLEGEFRLIQPRPDNRQNIGPLAKRPQHRIFIHQPRSKKV